MTLSLKGFLLQTKSHIILLRASQNLETGTNDASYLSVVFCFLAIDTFDYVFSTTLLEVGTVVLRVVAEVGGTDSAANFFVF